MSSDSDRSEGPGLRRPGLVDNREGAFSRGRWVEWLSKTFRILFKKESRMGMFIEERWW